MPIQIEFVKSHLSIGFLPTATLPDFTLITGKNGSGKSHLLQAINVGSIKADCAPNQSPNNQSEIRLFDWSNLIPQDTGLFSSEIIKNERQNIYQQIQNIRHNAAFIEPIKATARALGIEESLIRDTAKLVNLDVSDLDSHFRDLGRAQIAYEQLASAIKSSERLAFNHHDEQTRRVFTEMVEMTGKSLFSLGDGDVFNTTIPTWGFNNLFQQSFARLFVAYRDIYLENRLAQLQSSEGEQIDFLESAGFVEKYGPAPWDFVNTSLASAGLDFEINEPHLLGYTPYEPKLTKRSSGAQIAFQNLSSGEKILMSFAFCVYYAQDRRQISMYPKVILLDEVDAPLHPSMSRGLIEVIKNTLVGEFGIKVIATTHSPSTVAMADDSAIFVMHPNGVGLIKANKASALNALTEGVPTLSVSYSGRRQVFVESPSDAQNYSDLYRVLKSRLGSECSLEFIATGARSMAGQETNTGCDAVKRLVGDLARSGNTSVFGLLDWDQKHQPSDRIFVLAHDKRDGLENVLLDPLLLAALICHRFGNLKSSIGIDYNVSYLDFFTLPAPDLQKIATRVCEIVFDSPASETFEAVYLGGLRLKIDSRYKSMDDHALESEVLRAFPAFNSIARQGKPGLLMECIVTTILLDQKDFTPIEAFDVLKSMLEHPAH